MHHGLYHADRWACSKPFLSAVQLGGHTRTYPADALINANCLFITIFESGGWTARGSDSTMSCGSRCGCEDDAASGQ
jgi:hypothetical protein